VSSTCVLSLWLETVAVRGPIGASGLRALVSLVGVSPAGRDASSSRLAVGSASKPVSGGASSCRYLFLALPSSSSSASCVRHSCSSTATCCSGWIGSPPVAMAAAMATGCPTSITAAWPSGSPGEPLSPHSTHSVCAGPSPAVTICE